MSHPTMKQVPSNWLARNLRLDKVRELGERFLPSEIAHLDRDCLGDASLLDADVSAARNGLQRNGDQDFARQVGVIELVGVLKELARDQLLVLAAKRMGLSGREVLKRHLEGAADLGLQMMHFANEAVGG